MVLLYSDVVDTTAMLLTVHSLTMRAVFSFPSSIVSCIRSKTKQGMKDAGHCLIGLRAEGEP